MKGVEVLNKGKGGSVSHWIWPVNRSVFSQCLIDVMKLVEESSYFGWVRLPYLPLDKLNQSYAIEV